MWKLIFLKIILNKKKKKLPTENLKNKKDKTKFK